MKFVVVLMLSFSAVILQARVSTPTKDKQLKSLVNGLLKALENEKRGNNNNDQAEGVIKSKAPVHKLDGQIDIANSKTKKVAAPLNPEEKSRVFVKKLLDEKMQAIKKKRQLKKRNGMPCGDNGRSFQHRGRCFSISEQEGDWETGHSQCEDQGRLAVPKDIDMFPMLQKKAQNLSIDALWMGGHRMRWVMESTNEEPDISQQFISHFWVDKEETDAPKGEKSCVCFLSDSAQFDARSCKDQLYYVCETEISQEDEYEEGQLWEEEKAAMEKATLENPQGTAMIINEHAGAHLAGGDMRKPEDNNTTEDSGEIDRRALLALPADKLKLVLKYLKSEDTEHLAREIMALENRDRKSVVSYEQIWPNGRIYYIFKANNYNPTEQKTIRDAMDVLEQHTCLRFIPRTTETAYLIITKGTTCDSYVGYQGYAYTVNLGNGCLGGATIRHEFMHSAGWEHEHQRIDRDDYIRINWDNLDAFWTQWFKKFEQGEKNMLSNVGVAYDIESCMHYPITTYGKIGMGFQPLGLADAKVGGDITAMDILAINHIYSCSGYPVNGGWSTWAYVGPCSATCGGGTRTRTRSCNRPLPGSGGKQCTGDGSQTSHCMTTECPGGPGKNSFTWGSARYTLISDSKLTHSDAEAKCQTDGGQLLAIANKKEKSTDCDSA